MEELRLDQDKLVYNSGDMGYGWYVDEGGYFQESLPMVDGRTVERVELSGTDGILKFTFLGGAGSAVAGADRITW